MSYRLLIMNNPIPRAILAALEDRPPESILELA